MEYLFTLLEIVARGGGGGSGGGGGGGGGGLFVLWYYFVAYTCQTLMKLLKPLNYVVTFIFATFVTIAPLFLGLGFFGFITASVAALGAWMGATGRLRAMHKYLKEHVRIKHKLHAAAQTDSQWNWDQIKPDIEKLFYQFQNDWSALDLEKMKAYITPEYHQKMQLLLGALSSMNRQNIMHNVKILQLVPTSFNDSPHNDQDDVLVVTIEAKADDQLVEANQELYVDNDKFIEHWHFRRDPTDTRWLLSTIEQETRTKALESSKLQGFAGAYRFFYSGDFGWLLMPKRGQLFSKATFKNSDVNSHVIGVYRDVLVQFYKYIPQKKRNEMTGYTIAQAVLPKTYGNIVVRRRHTWSFGIKGLTKIELEWGDFNKTYEVFASDLERVTSLELLHPAFMVKLYELPFKTNIEIVDNIVYFYTSDMSADYDVLLKLLHEAFDEMKM